MELREEVQNKIAEVLNSASLENGSNTPDFILAQYLMDCLVAFDKATKARDGWHGNVTDDSSEL